MLGYEPRLSYCRCPCIPCKAVYVLFLSSIITKNAELSNVIEVMGGRALVFPSLSFSSVKSCVHVATHSML